MYQVLRSRLPLVWLLLAAALLVRAALPFGWMPAAHEGGITVQICTGDGPQTLTLDTSGARGEKAPQPVQPRDPCPFGLMSDHMAHLPLPPALPLAPVVLPRAATPALVAALLTAWRTLRPPARGPPAV